MAGAFSLRDYEDRDREDVVALFRRVNEQLAPPGMEAAFKDYAEQAIVSEMGQIPAVFQAEPGNGFWIAEEDGAMVGFVGIERLSNAEAELRRMYVDPDHRRRGIGRRLLDHIEAFCRNHGFTRLVLSTSAAQQAAIAAYRARGYRLVREEIAEQASKKSIGGGMRRYHFVMDLADTATVDGEI